MAVGAAEWIPAGTTMTGSVYVFRRTAPATWGQPVEILPPSQQANEEFGEVVALAPDGNTLYVSAPGANNTIGSVYQYVAIGGVWPTTPTHTLNDPNSSSEGYGAALAMSRDGTTLVVGASLLTGGNGGAYVYATSSLTALPTTLATALINNSGSLGTAIAVSDDGTVVAVGGNNEGGAVCVFKKSGATWSPNPIGDPAGAGAMNTGFGLAVALSGDGTSLVVGAASVPSPELVYTYTLNSSGAPVSTSPPSISVPNLPASSPSGFGFGDSLALSDDGSVLVVGAPSDTTLASGINGSEDATAPSNPAAGAVYVYRASAGSWTQTAYIKPSNTFAQQNPDGLGFGQAFSLSGDGTTLAVGAIGESSNAVGVPLTLDAGPDGGESNTSESFAGAVYVFH